MTSTVLAHAQTLGAHALGGQPSGIAPGRAYVFGTEGPHTYDCSGLAWRALTYLKLYRGSRFTTYTILHNPATRGQFVTIAATAAKVGDLVVWSENSAHGHMGIVSGPDQFYSAESPRAGIGYQRISTFHVYPVSPVFLRPKLAQSSGSPVTPKPVTHKVEPGDTLYDIAKAWGVTLTALEHANPKAGHPAGNFDILYAGDLIRHP